MSSVSVRPLLVASLAFFSSSILDGADSARADGQRRGVLDSPRVTASPSRLINASVRANVASGDSLIAGFVLSGNGSKPVLIRGVGPALAQFGVRDALGDPTLELHDIAGHRISASNRHWCTNSNANDISAADTRLGAFALPAGSNDSALYTVVQPGVYTANVFGPPGGSGTVLAELYDGAAASPARIVNLSARGRVGSENGVLILGFVVAGPGTKQLLLRGVGPSLEPLGVTGVLGDPRLELHDSTGALLAENQDWGGTPEVAAASNAVGAFALPSDSKDAALLASVSPGVYTLQVAGSAGASGVALAELYDVPLPEAQTRWTMINVSPNNEQADCHLLQFPDGRNVLVDIADAADAAGSALAYLQSHHITQVDLVVLTHFHRDHYGRLEDLISAGIKIGRVAYNMPSADDDLADAEAPWGFSRQEAHSVLDFLRDHQIPAFTPRSGDRLVEVPLSDGSSVTLDVVCLYDGAQTPVGKTDTNDTSIILKLTHGPTRVLFTGDLNYSLGMWLASSSFDVRAELLKVPHHGTEGCAPDAFFDRVQAKAAFVPSPAGLWNSVRSSRIRNYFSAQHIPTYVNGLNGTVVVTLGSAGYTIGSQ